MAALLIDDIFAIAKRGDRESKSRAEVHELKVSAVKLRQQVRLISERCAERGDVPKVVRLSEAKELLDKLVKTLTLEVTQ